MSTIYPGALAVLLLLAACADPPPPSVPASASETFEPAPVPGVHYVRQAATGPLTVSRPLQLQMPNTGAVPVSASPVRGTVTTNLLNQSF